MDRIHLTVIAVGTISLFAGCNRQDKDCLKQICLKSVIRVEGALHAFRKNFGEGWLSGAAVEARVAARLRWDKSLESATIVVGSSGDIIELSGTVTTAEQKRRAYELAVSTLGAKDVADMLQVTP